MSLIGAQLARKHMFQTAEEIEDRAITVRPASMAVFGVDSDDRYKTYAERRTNTTYPFSFQVTKNEALLNGFFTRLAVTEFRMYWTLPNISAAWGNNTLQIFITGGAANPYTITIQDGSYSLQALNARIQAAVRLINDGGPPLLPNFTASNNTDGSSFYDSTTATTWYWVRPTSNVRTMYDMLNLVNTYPETAATTQAGGVANLRPTDYIDIVSPQLTYNQDLKDGSTAPLVRDMLVRIYLDDGVNGPYRFQTDVFSGGPPPALSGFTLPQVDVTNYMNGVQPFTIYRQFPYPKQVQWNKTLPLGNITFTMYDDQQRSIQDLWSAAYPVASEAGQYDANSFVWNMTLLISES